MTICRCSINALAGDNWVVPQGTKRLLMLLAWRCGVAEMHSCRRTRCCKAANALRLSQRPLEITEALFLRLVLRDKDSTRAFIKNKLRTERLATGRAYCFRHLNNRYFVLPKCTLLRLSGEHDPHKSGASAAT